MQNLSVQAYCRIRFPIIQNWVDPPSSCLPKASYREKFIIQGLLNQAMFLSILG